jgi:hypothetical protein
MRLRTPWSAPATVEELVFPANYQNFQQTFSTDPANDNGYPPVKVERGDVVAAFGEQVYLIVQAVDTDGGLVWCLPYNSKSGNARSLPRSYPIANVCVFSKGIVSSWGLLCN